MTWKPSTMQIKIGKHRYLATLSSLEVVECMVCHGKKRRRPCPECNGGIGVTVTMDAVALVPKRAHKRYRNA